MIMVTTVQRWGNSLAVRIPKPFALQAALEENSEVDISVEGDRIVLSAPKREWTLNELLPGITRRNSHKEIRWGGRTGGEAW
jgi:antitoxin MazE